MLLSDDEQRETSGPGWDTNGPAQARDAYGGSPQWQRYSDDPRFAAHNEAIRPGLAV